MCVCVRVIIVVIKKYANSEINTDSGNDNSVIGCTSSINKYLLLLISKISKLVDRRWHCLRIIIEINEKNE